MPPVPPDDPPPRYRPKYDPRTPDDDYDGSHYGIDGGPADPAPTSEPPADAPRKRKKQPRPAGFGELDPKYNDRLLTFDAPPTGPPPRWWVPAAVVGGAGIVIGLAFLILLLTRVKSGSAGVAAVAVLGGLALEVAEVVGLTLFLMMFGQLGRDLLALHGWECQPLG